MYYVSIYHKINNLRAVQFSKCLCLGQVHILVGQYSLASVYVLVLIKRCIAMITEDLRRTSQPTDMKRLLVLIKRCISMIDRSLRTRRRLELVRKTGMILPLCTTRMK
uniref:Uncharacterized protein n=1 Tax=Cacopsylla melanoneura TaxID=428564 RepID=A0A8D8U1Y2_9HEMI